MGIRGKLFKLMIAMFAMTFFLAGCGEKPAMIVNGEKVFQKDIERRVTQLKVYAEQTGVTFEGENGAEMLAQLNQYAIDGIINEILLFQAAAKSGIEVSDREIRDIVQERKQKSFPDNKAYQDWLKARRFTEGDYERAVKYQIVGEKLFNQMTKDITVSDAEAEKFYRDNPSLWPEKVRVSHILVYVERDNASAAELAKAKAEAENIVAELNQGGNFADLAKKYSKDPGSADQGGVLDLDFSRDDPGLVPEFREGAFTLDKIGSYTQTPVLSEFGYHIIKLDAKKGSFEDFVLEVKNHLLQTEKNKVFQGYMEDLKKQAVINENP